jgi:hypothetical protein
MTYDQKTSRVFSTLLRKRLVIGATSVLAAGALLGVGVAGASAATVHSTTVAAHTSASATHNGSGHSRAASLVEQLRADLFQGQISGSKVQKLVERITSDQKLFAALPASLQSDLTSLKNAPAGDTVADAQKIKATALAGGYGQEIQNLATDLQATAKYPINKKVASTLSEHPQLLSKLPANLQSDVTALKNAPASDAAAQVQKIETTAVGGGYGQQIQKVGEQLGSLVGGTTK